MLKRVLFLMTVAILLLVPAPGCAPAGDDGSNAWRPEEWPVVYSFAPVSPTIREFQTPLFVFEVGYPRTITITAPDGKVIYTETIKPDGKGVYPAIFKGSTSGRPATLVNKGNPMTQVYTITVAKDKDKATANCSVTVVPARPTESVK